MQATSYQTFYFVKDLVLQLAELWTESSFQKVSTAEESSLRA